MRRVIWTVIAFVLCGGEDSAQARLDALWPELQVLCEAALKPLKRYRNIEQNIASRARRASWLPVTTFGYRVVDDQWRRISFADVQLDAETSIDESGRTGKRHQFDMSLRWNLSNLLYHSSESSISLSQIRMEQEVRQSVTQAFVGYISTRQRLRSDLSPSERRTARSKLLQYSIRLDSLTFGQFSKQRRRP
ncbi:MAG: hypothetical protein ACON3Z_18070 [Bradymonadia bacterium]